MKYLFLILTLLFCLTFISSPLLVNAEETSSGGSVASDINAALANVGKGAGYKAQLTLPELVGKIINILLYITGILMVVLFVYGGFLYMTSYGNKDKVEKAKTLMVDAVIGFIIIMAAYAISNFIVTQLVKATVS